MRVKRDLNKQRTVVPKLLVIGQGKKFKAKKIGEGGHMPSGILEIYLLWFAINKNFNGLMIFNPRMDKAASQY